MDQNSQRVGAPVQVGQLLPKELQQPVSFDDVQLTDAEMQEAVTAARKKKQGQLEYDRQKKIAEARKNDLMRPWTPNELYSYAGGRASLILQVENGDPSAVFEPQEFQKPAITALSLYFSNSPEFEQLDHRKFNTSGLELSLQKGIWLWGPVGVGKTLLMSMFSRNRRQCYTMVQCPKLVAGYVKSGDDFISGYSRVINTSADGLSFYQDTKGICFNDLGVEAPEAKHYGTPINVVESVFLDTYENKVPFCHRHVTTNLTSDQLKSTYGVRFTDRVKQCFNIIEINGESLRK